jgi:hypothetical protein
MTPADHNKVIGVMHLVYGGFFTLIAFLLLFIFGGLAAMVAAAGASDPDAPPAFFFGLIAFFIFVVYLVLSLPSLIAGYAMLKRKQWAKVAGVVAAVLATVSFPFGTALCVYTLWFLLGDAGKALESGHGDNAWRGSLGQGQRYGDYAQTSGHEREPAYRPPAEPPDWRNG